MKPHAPSLLLLFALLATIGSAQEKLGPALWKKIEAATPKALPQTPKIKLDVTDAQEEFLKGKVKRVIEEYTSFTDVCAPKGRLISNIDDYDLSGNLLRRVDFANCGQLLGINVYGFLDGSRVSHHKSIPSEERFTIFGSAPPEKPNPPTQKPDERYTYRYVYTFKEGSGEMRMFHNDGRRGMYYKYTYSPTEWTTSAYTTEDEHNWRSISKLDANGSEIERITVDVRKVYGGDIAYRVVNKSFDQVGNWTHQATYELPRNGGKSSETLVSESYRAITYH